LRTTHGGLERPFKASRPQKTIDFAVCFHQPGPFQEMRQTNAT
jgi:hypothetical protein